MVFCCVCMTRATVTGDSVKHQLYTGIFFVDVIEVHNQLTFIKKVILGSLGGSELSTERPAIISQAFPTVFPGL